MNYEVTIGIPVYQAVDYIEKTMESALNQTFKSIEYLVVDDCGNDGSINKVECFQNEHPRGKDIRILYNQQNLGVGKTRNIILEQAQGDYLFFLDSDDILELDAIEKMIKMAHLYQAEVVYGSWTRIDTIHHTPTQYSHYPDIQFLSSGQLAMYAFKNYSSFRISVCNALFKLSLIRASHLHFLDAMFWEDLSFTYDLVPKVNRAVLLSDITYHYICRPGSLSQYNDREQLDMEEILRNVSTIDYLKKECKQYEKRDYFPYLCYNLEMNSFYIVCYVLKHRQKIKQTINIRDLQNYMHIPIGLPKLLRFKKKKTACLALWMLPHLPSCLFLYSIRWIGKIKHVF